MLVDVQATLTDVMVVDAGGVLLLPPPQPAIHNNPRATANKVLLIVQAPSKPCSPGGEPESPFWKGVSRNLHFGNKFQKNYTPVGAN